MQRRSYGIAALAFAAAYGFTADQQQGFVASAQAADLNCPSVEVIVPWGAGGDTDIILRQVIEKANELGADPQFRITNIPGQGGNRGAAEFLDRAEPDGCTLLSIHDSVTTSYLTERIDYIHDVFQPVALLSYTPSVIGAHPDAPYDDMDGLIEAAKAEPGGLAAGSTIGSTSHFIFLVIEDAASVRFNHVPYEGTRERLTGMLSGAVDLGEMNIITANEYMADGELKGLGIALPERDPSAPDLPTLAEQGLDVEYGLSRGLVLPLGTDPAIIAHFEEIFEAAVNDPAMVEALQSTGTQPRYLNAEDYGQYLDEVYEMHERIAINIGLYEPAN